MISALSGRCSPQYSGGRKLVVVVCQFCKTTQGVGGALVVHADTTQELACKTTIENLCLKYNACRIRKPLFSLLVSVEAGVGMSRGRGRGRGRGKPFEGLGLAPGEPAPPPILQPPPLYPTLDRRPLQLRSSEVEDYLVTIKQDMKQHAQRSPYHLTPSDPKSTAIERYSDKLRKNGAKSDDDLGWDIDWNYFPGELRPGRTRKPVKSNVRPKIPERRQRRSAAGREDTNPGDESSPRRKKRKVSFVDGGDSNLLVKKLDSLEQAESADSEQSGEEENAEEVYDEHEDEEGTDYNLTYFDNGEDYDVGGDDDALEEAVY